MTNIFSDKATIVIRAMLSQPDKKWVARDYESEFGVGRARAAAVLSSLRKKGFVGGVRSGRLAHNVIQNTKTLLDEWLKYYSFEMNKMHLYYASAHDALPRLKKYFDAKKNPCGYALTVHTGANLITNYVNTQTVYCYLKSNTFDDVSLDLRQTLDLKELKTGGNFCLIKPYYKNGVFLDNQTIKSYNVVSNLQLYLDLYHFPQRGRDHAQYFLKTLKEEGKSFV
jgi:Uncharacterized protein conserved in bacteria (DUF2186).